MRKYSNESAKLVLNLSKDEYARELERANMLDSKAGVCLTASIAFYAELVLKVPHDYSTYLAGRELVVNKQLWLFFLILLLWNSVWTSIDGAYHLYLAMEIKSYTSVNLENLEDKENQCMRTPELELAFLKHVNSLVRHNRSVNEEKAEHVAVGIRKTVFGAICSLVLVLLLRAVLIG